MMQQRMTYTVILMMTQRKMLRKLQRQQNVLTRNIHRSERRLKFKNIVASRLIEAIDDCLRSVQVVVLSYLQDLAVSEMNIIKLNSHNGNFPFCIFSRRRAS